MPSDPAPAFAGELYDRLNIAACRYDTHDRLRAWNATWLRFFPEHEGRALDGEARRHQLLREARVRQGGDVPDHQADALLLQARAAGTPTLVQHHGRWLRGATQRLDGGGWLCLWTQVPAPAGPGRPGMGDVLLSHPADELQAARDQALGAERLVQLLAGQAGDAVLGLGVDGRIHYASPSVQSLLGFAPQEFVGHDLSHLVCSEDRPAFLAQRRQLRERGASAAMFTVRARHRTGALVWVEARVQAVPPEADPGGLAFVCHVRDVTERQAAQAALAAAQAELARCATHDPLTGLVHRRYFDELLQREWRRLQRERGTLAVLLIEADHADRWRERHGPLVADAGLRAVASVVREHARRAGDIAARHDAAVFATALPHTDTQAAMSLAERIRGMVEHGDVLPRGLPALQPTVSIGVACAVPGETAPDTASLLQAARVALVDAQAQGRNRVGWVAVQAV